jgi:hypothetical protein
MIESRCSDLESAKALRGTVTEKGELKGNVWQNQIPDPSRAA